MEHDTVSSSAVRAITRRRFLKDAGTTAAGLTVGATLLTRTARGAERTANDRIGVAIIGCGAEGNVLLRYTQAIAEGGENLAIVACCDVYRPRLERTAAAFSATPYMDYRALLDDPNVDAVIIATPDHIHGQQAIDAIQAGKDVYCEKPVTHWRQFELTKRLHRVVNASDRIFQLGSQYMSDAAWHQAAELVRDGAIGQPIHAECGFFRVGDWGERGMPIDDPNARPGPDLDWEAFLGDSPPRPFDVSRFFRWRMYWDYSGGPATDLYPHCLGQVIHMLGVTMPEKVVASGGMFRYEEREVPDTFSMLIDYPEKITIAVLGTQGNDHPGMPWQRPPGRSPVLRGWEGTLTFEGDQIVFTPAHGSTREPRRFDVAHGFGHDRHLTNFYACCRSRQQPDCPIDLAYHTQTPLQMGLLSLREGKVARFDRQNERIVL